MVWRATHGRRSLALTSNSDTRPVARTVPKGGAGEGILLLYGPPPPTGVAAAPRTIRWCSGAPPDRREAKPFYCIRLRHCALVGIARYASCETEGA